MDPKTHELVKKLFDSCFSAREKKIIRTDLFGESYPDDDLSQEACLRVIAKIRSSARNKLKALRLITTLSKYIRISEQDQVDIVDGTMSESEMAMRVLDCMNIKASFPIAALYIALLDTSSEEDGPPTHYQLACELKQIAQKEFSQITLTVPDKGISDSEPSTAEALDNCIVKLDGIDITETQARNLTERLGIEPISSCSLFKILNRWRSKKGLWSTVQELVEHIVLTPGTGRYLVLMQLPPYPQLKHFLEGLNEKWVNIAIYIGFEEFEFTSTDKSVSQQIDIFLKVWTIPDCGDKTVVILHKLTSVAGVSTILTKSAQDDKSHGGLSLETSIPVASSLTLHSTKHLPPPTKSLPAVVTPKTTMSPLLTTTVSVTHTPTQTLTTKSVNRSLSPEIPPTTSEQSSPVFHSLSSQHRRTKNIVTKIKPTIVPVTTTKSYVPEHSRPLIVELSSDSSDPTVTNDLSDYPRPRDSIVEKRTKLPTTSADKSETESWPQPIQQSNKTMTVPYTSSTSSSLHYSAPISVTNTTWSPSPHASSQSSQSYVASRSPEDSPVEEDETTAVKSSPPSFTSPVVSSSPVIDIVSKDERIDQTERIDQPVTPPPISADDTEANPDEGVQLRQEYTEEPDTSTEQHLISSSPEPEETVKAKGNSMPVPGDSLGNPSDIVCSMHQGNADQFRLYLQGLENPAREINRLVPRDYSENGNVLLNIATRLSMRKHVEVLLDFGADVDQIDEEYNSVSALHIASEMGDKEIMELLLARNATVDIRDKNQSTPLLLVNVHEPECVQLLLRANADVAAANNSNYTPLVIAVVGGFDQIVEMLLESNSSPDVINHLRCVDNNGDKYFVTPLADAAARGHLNILKMLAEKGANLNSTGEKGLPPDKNAGHISPLLLACMKNHVNIVGFVTEQQQFICEIDYIADPVTEALKNGNVECAALIWERYGGLQQLLRDSNDFPELKQQLQEYVRGQEGQSTLAISQPDHSLPVSTATIEDDPRSETDTNTCEIVNELSESPVTYEINDLNDLSAIEEASIPHRHKEKEQPVVAVSKTPAAALISQPPVLAVATEVNDFSDIESTASRTSLPTVPTTDNILNDLSGSETASSLPPVSVKQPMTLPAPLQLESAQPQVKDSLQPAVQAPSSFSDTPQLSSKTTLALNDFSDVETTLSQLPAQSGAMPSKQRQTAESSLLQLIPDSGTDTDDPFASRPKTPPRPSTPPPPVSDIPSMDIAGNLRHFQTSAIEVLHDFAQYLIQACLQKNSSEEIIAKAEIIGETSLVHFFSRYFHDAAGATRGSEFVAEFIKGFPSPLNFLLSAQLCNKDDFVGVLREFGREDFADQLMLALHQFPDSDNIPWSGAELLNSLFRQHFSVGTPFPMAAMQDRRLQPTRPAAAAATPSAASQEPSFPGPGRVLGRRENIPDTSRFVEEKKTTDVSQSGASVNALTDKLEKETHPVNLTDTDAEDKARIKSTSIHTTLRVPPKEELLQKEYPLEEQMALEKTEKSASVPTPPDVLSVTDTVSCTNNLDEPALSSDNQAAPVTLSASVTGKFSSADQHTKELTSSDEPNKLDGEKLKDLSPLPVKKKPRPIETTSASIDRLKKLTASTSDSDDEVPSAVTSKIDDRTKRSVSAQPTSEPESESTHFDQQKVHVTTDSESETSEGTLPASQSAKPSLTSHHKLSAKSQRLTEHTTKSLLTKESPREVRKPLAGHRPSPDVSPKVKRSLPTVSGARTVTSSVKSSAHPMKVTAKTVSPSTSTQSLKRPPISTLPNPRTNLKPASAATRPAKVDTLSTKLSPTTGRNIHVQSTSLPSKVKPTSGRDQRKEPVPKHKTSGSDSSRVKSASRTPETVPKLKTRQVHQLSEQYDVVRSQEVMQKLPVLTPLPRLKVSLPSVTIEAPISLFEMLASKMQNWKMLGRYLLLDDDSLSTVSMIGSDTFDQAIQMLKLWFKQAKASATYQTLGEALVNCMKDDLIVVLDRHSKNPKEIKSTKEEPTSSLPSDDYDITMTVPLTKLLVNLKPFVEAKEKEGASKVTVSLKFE